MNNFNFVHSPAHENHLINLNTILSIWTTDNGMALDGTKEYGIHFSRGEENLPDIWSWPDKNKRDKCFNALLKLTSQNLCNEASLSSDSPQTYPTTPEQNSETHPPHRETNPF